MPQYLCTKATFLAEKYHGNEWPPSPARFFQALLAGARTGVYRSEWARVEPALTMLEKLPAPDILAARARRSRRYRISAPNNDLDRAAKEWASGRPFDVARLRTLKEVSPWVLAHGASDFHICYFWKLDGLASIEAFQILTSFLHTLGWGVDMAYASASLMNEEDKKSLLATPGCDHYQPCETGFSRNIPLRGYLVNLTDTYARARNRQSVEGIDAYIRADGHGQQRYRRVGDPNLPKAKFFLRQLGHSERWYSQPWSSSMKVAAWMRRATADALREEGYPQALIDSYVLGHGDGHSKHISFVPVPTIDTMHGDGAVRRVMLVEPADADGTISSLLQWKLAPSQLKRLTEGGPPQPVCSLAEASPGDHVFRRYDANSSIWHSVTPVVLHGHNTERRKFSLKKTERLLTEAFEESGYPRNSILSFSFQSAPLWRGTGGAISIRVPQHLEKWPRFHVAVQFKTPVSGPVLVGIGRHYGIGLFAAPLKAGN